MPPLISRHTAPLTPPAPPPGYDVIAQAQSGTGKTATFAISILQQIELDLKATQALVLAPTRELAQQVISLQTSTNQCRPVETTADEYRPVWSSPRRLGRAVPPMVPVPNPVGAEWPLPVHPSTTQWPLLVHAWGTGAAVGRACGAAIGGSIGRLWGV